MRFSVVSGHTVTKRIPRTRNTGSSLVRRKLRLLTGMWNRVRAILFENLGLSWVPSSRLLLYAHVVTAGT